jgi:flagellar hook-associated protein 3 FlgL
MNIAPISQSAITSLMASELNSNQNSLTQLELMLSSGQNISQPSDNPAGIEQLLGVSSSQTRFTQYVANAQSAMSVAQLADSTLNNALTVIQSARDTMLAAGGPGVTPTSAVGLIDNLKGDMSSLLALSNTAYQGNAIFAGTSGSTTAYDSSGNYVGSSSSPTTTVSPGFSAPITVTAPFGTTGSSSNIFTVLKQAITDLQSGNYTAVASTDVGSLDTAFNGVTSAAATQGQYYQTLSTMQLQATQALQSIQTQYGNLQNINTAQVSTEYSQQLSNYQVALNVASKAVEPTLAQYI